MRAGKLPIGRPALRAATVIAIGLAILFAGIYCGFDPAYVVWQLTDFNDLSRWLEWYQLNPQIQLMLNSHDVWTGTIGDLMVELAVVNSLLLIGAITILCGVRVLRRERFRRRTEVANGFGTALA
jgi:hypothetical protein